MEPKIYSRQLCLLPAGDLYTNEPRIPVPCRAVQCRAVPHGKQLQVCSMQRSGLYLSWFYVLLFSFQPLTLCLGTITRTASSLFSLTALFTLLLHFFLSTEIKEN